MLIRGGESKVPNIKSPALGSGGGLSSIGLAVISLCGVERSILDSFGDGLNSSLSCLLDGGSGVLNGVGGGHGDEFSGV